MTKFLCPAVALWVRLVRRTGRDGTERDEAFRPTFGEPKTSGTRCSTGQVLDDFLFHLSPRTNSFHIRGTQNYNVFVSFFLLTSIRGHGELTETAAVAGTKAAPAMVTLAAPRWTKASTLPTTYAPTPSSTTRRRSSPIDFANYFCTYDFANLLKKFRNREVPTWPIKGYDQRDEKSKSAICVLFIDQY
ncbi:hypothetical protein ACFX1X_044204 [Malus domestica]